MNAWKKHTILSIVGVGTPNICDPLVHHDALRDVFRKVPVREVHDETALHLLHRGSETFEAVASLDDCRHGGIVCNLSCIDGLQVRLQVWDLMRFAGAGLELANSLPDQLPLVADFLVPLGR